MDNIIYGVVYPGGSSGQFIKSMLAYMLLDETTDMDFSDGTSHCYYKDYLKKQHYLLGQASNNIADKYKILASSKINPKIDSPKLPLDFKKINEYGCVYKLLYIHADPQDLPEVSANHYYKQPANIPHFAELSSRLFSTSDLSLLTREQERMLINHPGVISSINDYLVNMNKWISSVPKEFHNSLYRIDFSDIMNNRNKVKSLLETVTNKAMSEDSHRQYDRYIERQIQFRQEKNF